MDTARLSIRHLAARRACCSVSATMTPMGCPTQVTSDVMNTCRKGGGCRLASLVSASCSRHYLSQDENTCWLGSVPAPVVVVQQVVGAVSCQKAASHLLVVGNGADVVVARHIAVVEVPHHALRLHTITGRFRTFFSRFTQSDTRQLGNERCRLVMIRLSPGALWWSEVPHHVIRLRHRDAAQDVNARPPCAGDRRNCTLEGLRPRCGSTLAAAAATSRHIEIVSHQPRRPWRRQRAAVLFPRFRATTYLNGLGGVHAQQPGVRAPAQHQHRVQRIRRQRHVVHVHRLARHLPRNIKP